MSKTVPPLVGQRFSLWLVLGGQKIIRNGISFWLCRCDCGTEKLVAQHHLISGATSCCGCRVQGRVREIHGHTARGGHRNATPEYSSWTAMKNRCSDESNSNYHKYGGRGITVCPAWIFSFTAFLRDMGRRPDGKTLERIDVNLGYSKANCTWATPKEQANNKRNTIKVFWRGESLTLSQVAQLESVNRAAIYHRIVKRRMSITEAISDLRNHERDLCMPCK